MDSTVTVALITAISGGIGWIVKRFVFNKSSKASRHQANWASGCESIHSVYESLSSLVYRTRASRAIICRYENGGGVPRPGRPVIMTIIYEVHDSDTSPSKDQWQRRELNESEYFECLVSVLNNKSYSFLNSEAAKDSIVRMANEVAGVARTESSLLYQSSNSIYVLSLHFPSAARIDPQDEVKIDAATSDMRNMFSRRRPTKRRFFI